MRHIEASLELYPRVEVRREGGMLRRVLPVLPVKVVNVSNVSHPGSWPLFLTNSVNPGVNFPLILSYSCCANPCSQRLKASLSAQNGGRVRVNVVNSCSGKRLKVNVSYAVPWALCRLFERKVLKDEVSYVPESEKRSRNERIIPAGKVRKRPISLGCGIFLSRGVKVLFRGDERCYSHCLGEWASP